MRRLPNEICFPNKKQVKLIKNPQYQFFYAWIASWSEQLDFIDIKKYTMRGNRLLSWTR